MSQSPSSSFGIVEERKLSCLPRVSSVICKSNPESPLPSQLPNCDSISLAISSCLGNASYQPINYGAVVINS